jgi:hypothetical protein
LRKVFTLLRLTTSPTPGAWRARFGASWGKDLGSSWKANELELSRKKANEKEIFG